MLNEGAIHMDSCQIGFGMPLHTEVPGVFKRFDDTVGCGCTNLKTWRNIMDRLMMS